MPLGPERRGRSRGSGSEGLLHRVLDLERESHILGGPTTGADQMVVMTEECLGELVRHTVVDRGHGQRRRVLAANLAHRPTVVR